MKLQADPTIQYILSGPPKALSNRDLRVKSDYNTYQNYGLPPGPINNPGIESIKAALFPKDTNFLFFVAQGDGSHAFTTNEKDILYPNYPKVDVLDWYHATVRGDFSKNIGITAKLYNSDAKLFGAPTR